MKTKIKDKDQKLAKLITEEDKANIIKFFGHFTLLSYLIIGPLVYMYITGHPYIVGLICSTLIVL